MRNPIMKIEIQSGPFKIRKNYYLIYKQQRDENILKT